MECGSGCGGCYIKQKRCECVCVCERERERERFWYWIKKVGERRNERVVEIAVEHRKHFAVSMCLFCDWSVEIKQRLKTSVLLQPSQFAGGRRSESPVAEALP